MGDGNFELITLRLPNHEFEGSEGYVVDFGFVHILPWSLLQRCKSVAL